MADNTVCAVCERSMVAARYRVSRSPGTFMASQLPAVCSPLCLLRQAGEEIARSEKAVAAHALEEFARTARTRPWRWWRRG